MVTGNEGNTAESNPFSKEQMELLQRLFNSSSQNPNPSIVRIGSLAQKGIFLNALKVKKENFNSCIVDSGASDHMAEDPNRFHNYNPCYDNLNVRIADGSLSKVAGTGSVVISETLTLNSVLLVPKLDCNLLSISKLTQELNCIFKFFPKH